MAGGFQTAVNTSLAPAVVGDFSDHNPRVTVDAGPGGLFAGAAGITVGYFGWLDNSFIDPDNAAQRVNNFGTGVPAGLCHRGQQALITAFLADAGLLMPSGFPVTLFSRVGLWVKNDGSAFAQVGMKAYADFLTGKVSFAAAASASTASFTGVVAASTFSVTGTISNNVMNVTVVGSGVVVPGATISGTGVVSTTKVVSQLSGAVGGVGTYAVSIPEQSVASTTISGTYGTLTASAVTGVIEVGGVLSGSGVVAGTAISALGTGAGGAGTYIVNNNTVVGSTACTSTLNVETSWVAQSAGANGELVKITNW